jgi:hypothetical protein
MHPRSRLKKPVYVYKPRDLKRLKKASWKPSFKKILKLHKRALLYALIIFIVIMVLIPPATYLYFAKDLQSKDSIMNRQETGLTLLDRNGKPFYTYDLAKTITYVPISQIPETTQHALVAAEDKSFYTDPGFSVTGIVRAFLADIFAGKVVQGGSTITQELAKNAFLNSSQNVLRKYQELVLAAELTRRFNKQDILVRAPLGYKTRLKHTSVFLPANSIWHNLHFLSASSPRHLHTLLFPIRQSTRLSDKNLSLIKWYKMAISHKLKKTKQRVNHFIIIHKILKPTLCLHRILRFISKTN